MGKPCPLAPAVTQDYSEAPCKSIYRCEFKSSSLKPVWFFTLIILQIKYARSNKASKQVQMTLLVSWKGAASQRKTLQVEKNGQDINRSSPPPQENNRWKTKSHKTYIVLHFPAGIGVDRKPSLLVLGLDVGVLGCQGVLDLQAGRHTGNLAVARVCQHSGQFHQEGRLGREEGSAPTPACLPAPPH